MPNQKIVTEAALSAIASDIKNALSGKANSNDVYLKSQTYNRTEIDNALNLKADKSELYNVYPTDQESGAIASFTDGADNIPVKSLVSQIVAVESGNGQPKSPDNPYTISGFANGVVTVCGKNFIDSTGTWFGTDVTSWGLSDSGLVSALNKLPIGSYTVTFKVKLKELKSGFTGGRYGVIFRAIKDDSTQYNAVIQADKTNVTVGDIWEFSGSLNITSDVIGRFSAAYFYTGRNPTSNADTCEFYDLQIEQGSATTYEAYNGNTYTFAFGQTVYGGYFDNKGNLVVTHKEINLSTLSWSATTLGSQNVWRTSLPNDCKGYADNFVPTNILCEQYEPNSVDNMYSGNSGVSLRTSGSYIYCSRTDLNEPQGKLIAELITPITLSITSQDIPTLLGENNIFSNCGDVEVDYHADIGLYIEKKISSLAQG